jgi:HEAT repeat protein
MALVLDMPPDISSTKPVPAIYSQFHDEQALLNSALLAELMGESDRYVEVDMEACPPSYEELALSNPDEILRLLGADLAPHELTFVAEAAGKLADGNAAVAALLPLLSHASPFVREGTIYGLSRFATREAVRERLAALAAEDSSPGVREAAREALDA